MTEIDIKNFEASTPSGKARIIKTFLGAPTVQKLKNSEQLSDDDYARIVLMGFNLIDAVPESVGKIKLPNGKKFPLDLADPERKVIWDFEDLKKYADTLEQSEVFTRPRFKQF